eukprot:346049-Chlamydomonas_euryale.AAC.1
MDERMDDTWMGGWMDGWMGGWMDGWIRGYGLSMQLFHFPASLLPPLPALPHTHCLTPVWGGMRSGSLRLLNEIVWSALAPNHSSDSMRT